jgi:hypothetical protein
LSTSTPEPTPEPAAPRDPKPTAAAPARGRALVLLGGALVLVAVALAFASGGDDKAAKPESASPPPAEEAVEPPERSPLRSPGFKRRKPNAAPAEQEVRPAPESLGEVEALLEEDPSGALAWIASLKPANDGEAEQLKALEIRALAGAGRLGKARSEAKVYYERWPDGASTPLLEELTGVRPHAR